MDSPTGAYFFIAPCPEADINQLLAAARSVFKRVKFVGIVFLNTWGLHHRHLLACINAYDVGIDMLLPECVHLVKVIQLVKWV